nr:unnamed protein product [Callosobruchus chinensis]CAH7720878.1 unnamed protein product [Callosobruchus chinensis]
MQSRQGQFDSSVTRL